MNIKATGNLRSIADSAWISTTGEIAAKKRSDEDVDKVTKFLAKNMHTSPFECVTLELSSLYMEGKMPSEHCGSDFKAQSGFLQYGFW
jgi:hypothetical protein